MALCGPTPFLASRWPKACRQSSSADPKVQGRDPCCATAYFTFADDARSAYELMIEMVTLAEARLAKGSKTMVQAQLPAEARKPVTQIAPIYCAAQSPWRTIRAKGKYKRQILCFRSNREILQYTGGVELGALFGGTGCRRRPTTPSVQRIGRCWFLPRPRMVCRNGQNTYTQRSPISSPATTPILRATMRA